jgi:predicted hotdog family 3-hydroxylacyl-ACP dehydratase
VTAPLFDLLPHRPPMLLLEGVDAEGAYLTVDPAAWYADGDGAMPGWFGLEVMAQAVAAFQGARWEGPPRAGYLVGTRAYTSVPAFPAGARLAVRVRPADTGDSALAAFDCEILLGSAVAASATLKVILT